MSFFIASLLIVTPDNNFLKLYLAKLNFCEIYFDIHFHK